MSDDSDAVPDNAAQANAADADRVKIPGIESLDVEHAFNESQLEAAEGLSADYTTKRTRPEGDPETITDTDVQNVAATVRPGAPAAALSGVAGADALNPESAFNDMRDPMTAPDGTTPSKGDVARLTAAFTVAALACAVPWTALTVLLMPAALQDIDAGNKVTLLGVTTAVAALVALCSNVLFGTLSDLTRSTHGKRTPWIVAGGLLTGAAIWLLSAVRSSVAGVLIVWSVAQIGYAMMVTPLVAAMGERVPDKFRQRTARFYGAGMTVGQTVGVLAGAWYLGRGGDTVDTGWTVAAALFALAGIVIVLMWPREKSSDREPHERFSLKAIIRSLTPPRHAPDFRRAVCARLLMGTAYGMIVVFLLYIAQDWAGAGESAAWLVAVMALIALAVTLVAAWTAGPVTERVRSRRILAATACLLFAVGVALPLVVTGAAGLCLMAAVAGLGYGAYSAIGQALDVSVLPDPDAAGRDLGLLNLADTLSTVIGSVFTLLIVLIVKASMSVTGTPRQAYAVVFIVAIVIVLIAAWLIMRIRKAH